MMEDFNFHRHPSRSNLSLFVSSSASTRTRTYPTKRKSQTGGASKQDHNCSSKSSIVANKTQQNSFLFFPTDPHVRSCGNCGLRHTAYPLKGKMYSSEDSDLEKPKRWLNRKHCSRPPAGQGPTETTSKKAIKTAQKQRVMKASTQGRPRKAIEIANKDEVASAERRL